MMKRLRCETVGRRLAAGLATAVVVLALGHARVQAATTTTTTYLSDMRWTSATNAYGPVEVNRSNGEDSAGDGATITLNGVTYAKGLGTHAGSDVRYAVAPGCTRFTAVIGVDDEVGSNGTVTFQVWTDGVQRYSSGIMTGAIAGKSISVDVAGASQLALITLDSGDGSNYDHGDWANPQLTCTTSTPTTTTTSLTDRAWTSATNNYGPVEVNRSNGEDGSGDGATITLNGMTYARGLGIHAAADVRYALGGTCSTFTAIVGVDDEVGANGSVVFQVWTDGVKRYDSGVLTGADPGKNLSVDISGASQLALIASDAGDGSNYDHGDWANPQLTCSSSTGSTGTETGSSTGSDTGTAPAPATSVRALNTTSSGTATVTISPTSASLSPGAAQQFSAVVAGTTNTRVTWTATGGTVTSGGAYTAPSTAGTYKVTATITGGTISASATVTVAASPSTPPPPSGAIAISPGQSIQAAVDAAPTGSAFLLKSGVHRMQTIRPKSGDSFVGETGTVLSGARLLTAFSRSGSYWVASGQTQQGTVHGECQAGYPRCSYPEQLFIDDVALLHVARLADVAPGKWFFDYNADQIYMADDPTGHRVETSVTTDAFEATGNNVTISNLTIEKYANLAQFGAIQTDGVSGWVISGNEVRWNHGLGIRVSTGAKVTGNNVHHNGQLGIGGGGTNVLVEGNQIAYNNAAGFDYGWEAGGTKFAGTTGLILRNNNAHHNNGPGLWLDIDNINYLIEGNTTEDNYATIAAAAPGIFIEISYGGVIRNNIARRNGRGFDTWLWGAGILVAASGGDGLEITGNTIEDNVHGITLIQQQRGSGAYGTYLVQNVYVHDNTIRMSSGMTGGAQDTGDGSIFTSRNNRFVHNTYYLAGGGHFAWMNGERSDVEWRGYGMDTNGTFNK
jgi:hypothetical protein